MAERTSPSLPCKVDLWKVTHFATTRYHQHNKVRETPDTNEYGKTSSNVIWIGYRICQFDVAVVFGMILQME